MPRLITDPNLDAPDDAYAALLAAHEGLDTEATHALNARLILILANHVGSAQVVAEAASLARATAPEAPAPSGTPDPDPTRR